MELKLSPSELTRIFLRGGIALAIPRSCKRVLAAAAFLLAVSSAAYPLDCYTWRVENAWLTKDGTDPAALAYEAVKPGYTGPSHPYMSLSAPRCTINGDPSVGPATAECSMTVHCVVPGCPSDRTWGVSQIVRWRAVGDCQEQFYASVTTKQDQKTDSTCVGDPIFPASGAVYKSETDIPEANGVAGFKRFYNSGSSETGFGQSTGWSHSFRRRIVKKHQPLEMLLYASGDSNSSSMYGSPSSACSLGFAEVKSRVPEWQFATASYSGGNCSVTLPGGASIGTLAVLSSNAWAPLPSPVPVTVDAIRDDGQKISFQVAGSNLVAPPSIALRLEQTATGFALTNDDDSVEAYDLDGRLLSITSRAGVAHTMTYDASNRLTGIADSFGHALTLQYDLANRLVGLTDAGVRTVQYGYDVYGRLATVNNGDGTSRTYVYESSSFANYLTGIIDEAGVRLSTWTYDSRGRGVSTYESGGANAVSVAYNPDNTVTVTEPLGATHTFSFSRQGDRSLFKSNSGPRLPNCNSPAAKTYDSTGYPASITDYNGGVTTFVHDGARGLETSRTEAYGTSLARTITTVWNPVYRLPDEITEPNRITAFTYDPAGNLLSRTVTDTSVSPHVSRAWTYTYDSFGRVLTEDGPRTDVSDLTTYTYYTCTTGYQCGQLHTITNALGHITNFNTYNAFGQPLTVTDPNGVITTVTYDTRRRPTSLQVGVETTTLDYWSTGLVRQVTLPDSSFLRYAYDNAHRLKRIEDSLGNRIEYTLDAMGNRVSESAYDLSGALARTSARVFNSLGQLWKDVPSVGSVAVTTTYAYDSEGNQIEAVAPLARVTENDYDVLNRLEQITDPDNGITAFSYDTDDNLASVTDPKGLVTTYSYNGFGDRTEQVSPDTGLTARTFDSAGNIYTSTDARGITGTHSYDVLNRLTSISYPDRTLSFSYDSGTNGAGRLTGAVDASHSMAWSYDANGRTVGVTQVVGGVMRTVGYNYANGNLSHITTPSGQTVSYGYTNGQISSVAVNGITVLSELLYDPFGPPRQWTWGNGSASVRTHDLDGNVSQLDTGGDFYEYSYDDALRISGISNSTSSTLSWAYGYDALDRLTSGATSARSEAWSYDSNGNRLTESGTAGGQMYSSTYAAAPGGNRLNEISGSRSNSYSYDAAGNIVAESNPGRPISVGSATSVSYQYNALSERIWKSGPVAPTYFVYDLSGHLLGEYGSGGTLIQETVWLGDTPVATLRPKAGGGVDIFYVHTDHLGAARKVSRPSDSSLVWRWDPTAFGAGLPNENPDGAGTFSYNLRFPGQYYDAESGLHYNYFRDGYDPATGRYTQSDPIGLAGGINTYAYVENDPLNWIDPLGLAKYAPKNTDEAWCLRYPAACKELRKDLYDLLKRKKKSGVSGKEGAKDCPSWVKQDGGPLHNESGKDYAKRMLDEQYGAGNWADRGPSSEFNQIKKWADRSFE